MAMLNYQRVKRNKEDQKKERSTWAADLFPNADFLVGCNLKPVDCLGQLPILKVVSLGQLPMIFTTTLW
jgi:hypothetical protein